MTSTDETFKKTLESHYGINPPSSYTKEHLKVENLQQNFSKNI